MSSYWESVREAYVPFENSDIQGTLTKLKANAPLLVAQFRNLSNTTSHFLNAIEEICQTQPNDPRSPVLAKSKKPIYAAMGTLFIVSQTITRADMDDAQLVAVNQDLIECTRGIESGIQQVIEAAQMHVEEPIMPRDTPTPTQRHLYANDSISEILPATPSATSTSFTASDIGSGDLANNIRSLNGNLSAGELSLDDTSSYNSDMTATQQARKDSKIAKFFGEDTIAAARQRDTLLGSSNASVISVNQIGSSAASIAGTEQVWFLGSDVDTNEMVINLEGNVKGGTLHGLVIYLTQHDQLGKKHTQ
jgi:son of sevenless-like protein